jgi:hypothetical protein
MIEWTKTGKNDFKWTSPCGNYTLRVEKLDGGLWWWNCVYLGKELASSWYSETKTEKKAKAKAEVAYLAASAMLKITKTKAH